MGDCLAQEEAYIALLGFLTAGITALAAYVRRQKPRQQRDDPCPVRKVRPYRIKRRVKIYRRR